MLLKLLVGGQKYDPLIFREIDNDTTRKERISVCHMLQGHVSSEFSYHVSKHGNVVKLYSGKAEAYCSFYGSKVILGKIVIRDLNECYTLTKAQIKRGGRPTYTEYNPTYSVYKDGMIYWRCQRGKKPNRVENWEKTNEVPLYRYTEDPSVLLIKGGYYNYYLSHGIIFRSVGEKGNATTYNEDKVKIQHAERFDFSPQLLQLGP
ncbi:hypothetical protein [Agarivorans sp. QJM3NY_33]|uniref:hypothetical protein n=1 Tax=Agarivorans sp. QJM3NY_33 TaxID=3421432 RepID=UPI003D7DDC31